MKISLKLINRLDLHPSSKQFIYIYIYKWTRSVLCLQTIILYDVLIYQKGTVLFQGGTS